MRCALILWVVNTHNCTHPAAPRRLEWPDEAEAPAYTSVELRQLQRQFWARFGLPIFDTRCVDYPEQQLVWD